MYEPNSILIAEKKKKKKKKLEEEEEEDCMNQLTRKPNLRFPMVSPLTGRSMPWLVWRQFRISADELRTGFEKYKYTFSLL
jgi:hypothetical protein